MADSGLTTCAAFAILFNISLSSGFLVVPWVFNLVGTIPSLVGNFIILLLSLASSLLFVDGLARTEVLRARKTTEDYDKNQALMHETEKIAISPQTIEITEILELNFGRFARLVIICVMTICNQFQIAGHMSLFASSMAQNVPILSNETCNIYENPDYLGTCRWKYWIYQGIYTVIVSILTLIGLKKQKSIQILTAVIKVIILSAMFITSIFSLYGGYQIGTSDSISSPQVDFHTVSLAFTLFAFSTGYGSMIPTVLHPLKDKRKIPLLLFGLNIFVFLVTVSLGLIIGLALEGADPPSQCNLTWRDYGMQDERELWTVVIEYVIILFPAFSIIFSLPLGCIVMASNLARMFNWPADSKFFRVMIFILPILLAALVHDFGELASYVGILAVLVNFIFGSAIYLKSYNLVPRRTAHSQWYSNSGLAWVTLIWGCGILLLSILVHFPI